MEVIAKTTQKLYKGMPSLNPNGRPKGSLNESTYIKKALKRIAKNEGKKDEIDIVVSYVQKALKGNTPILLDYMNRTFGVPKPIEQQQVMQPIIIIPSSLSDKYNVVSETITPLDKQE